MLHSKFISSNGDRGFYELKEDNEVIVLSVPVNSLSIEAKDIGLEIKLNDSEDHWFIDAGRAESVTGLKVTKMQVMNSTGTLIRWKGLSY